MPRTTYNKHEVLKYIFMQKTQNGTQRIGTDIDFTLKEVGDGIIATGGIPPTSWSNFVLDLTRKRNTISQRLPAEVISFGYDLRKKTGKVPGNQNEKFCGTFVYRGKDDAGHTIPIQDWLEWGTVDRVIEVDSNEIPELVRRFISNDEASLFSIIDYCDILSKVLNQTVYRVQSPMKWQPNEIDGFYAAQDARNTFIYPVEAKAVSTQDDINIVQINGQFNTLVERYTRNNHTLIVRPIAARMESDGVLLAILEHNQFYDPRRNREAQMFNVIEVVKAKLNPPLSAWQ